MNLRGKAGSGRWGFDEGGGVVPELVTSSFREDFFFKSTPTNLFLNEGCTSAAEGKSQCLELIFVLVHIERDNFSGKLHFTTMIHIY